MTKTTARIAKAFSIVSLTLGALSPGAHASRESWYFYPIGLGYARPSYSSGISGTLNTLSNSPGVSRLTLALDLLGIYFPVGAQSVLGVAINASSDQYSVGATKMNMQTQQYALSWMYGLGDEPGKGFFFRADAGGALAVVEVSGTGLAGSGTSKWGVGGLGGIGYGIPIGDGTRLLFQINEAIRRIEGESYLATAVTAGILF